MEDLEFVPLIAGMVMVIVGCGLLRTHFKLKSKLAQVKFWPRIPVVIKEKRKTGIGPKIVGSDDYRQYRVHVQYTYDIDGKLYNGTRIVYGPDIMVHTEVDTLFDLLQDSAALRAYYSPDDHSEATLLHERPSGKHNQNLFFGCIMCGAGGLVALFSSGLHSYLEL